MSKEFIEGKIGLMSLATAVRQKEQLNYFTKSEVQEDFQDDYLIKWAQRKYRTNDYFLNWVKGVFKENNFLSFFKYYRKPNPSSELIHNKVRDQLDRVKYSDNSYFEYNIAGEKVKEPKELKDGFYTSWIDKALFYYNDLIVHDFKENGEACRYIVDIDLVFSIETEDNKITKVAYSGTLGELDGFVYIDSERHAFYDKNYNVIVDNPHGLGYCPVCFVSPYPYFKEAEVRKSIFTYSRADLEEYSFLKTLDRMVTPNGAIPVVAKLKTNEKNKKGQDKAAEKNHPMAASLLQSQSSQEMRGDATISQGNDITQAGTVVDISVHKDEQGRVDTGLVQNFIKWHYIDPSILEFISKKIQVLENRIISSIVGDYKEDNDKAMNEMQVSKGFVSKEDRLRQLSEWLTYTRSYSDQTLLDMVYGAGRTEVNLFYGSDFFIDGEKDLYERYEKSPNPIERNSILRRLSRTRNMFNPDKALREKIMYDILPFSSDKDYESAVSQNLVNPITSQLYTRFDYWVAMFESQYGKINQLWEETEAEDSEKMVMITNLLYLMIKNTVNDEQNNSSDSGAPESVQGQGA